MIMNIPNFLTFSRIAAAPFAVGFLFIDVPNHYLIALLIFVIAAFTDVLDGWIARKFKMESKLGRFFDPLADKILNLVVIIALLYLNVFPLWVVLLILVRDFVVDAFINLQASMKIFRTAIISGKVKTLFVTFAIITGELGLAVKDGLNLFDWQAIELFNAAYIMLIIAFVSGLIVSPKNLIDSVKKVKL